MLLIVENIYIYDIESISLLDGEYGKPIYRYDIILYFVTHSYSRRLTYVLYFAICLYSRWLTYPTQLCHIHILGG